MNKQELEKKLRELLDKHHAYDICLKSAIEYEKENSADPNFQGWSGPEVDIVGKDTIDRLLEFGIIEKTVSNNEMEMYKLKDLELTEKILKKTDMDKSQDEQFV